MLTDIFRGHRKLTVMKDSLHNWPELWMEVYIEGDKSEQAAFAEMLVRGHCSKAKDPESADLVIFTGGPDVNPIYYDEDKHPETSFDSRRDETDLKLYELCLEKGIPMLGVCRGAQFLHVMNGGKLFQHVDNHNGDHNIWDLKENRLIHGVSSVHHQMCISNRAGGMEVLATANIANNRWKNPTENVVGNMEDIEAFFYRDTCCLGVQGHPEYRGYAGFAKWTMEKLYQYIVTNPDIELTEKFPKVRRLKKEFLEERNARWAKETLGTVEDEVYTNKVTNATEETVH